MPSARPELFNAIERGNPRDFEAALEKGADPLAPDREGRTPLMIAAEWGQDAIVSALAACGELDKRDSSGSTALMLAVRSGRTGSVRLLLQAGARTDFGDLRGNTPMTIAAWKGNLEAFNALVGAGAPFDAASPPGKRELFNAATDGNWPVVRGLLWAVVDPVNAESALRDIRANMGAVVPSSVADIPDLAQRWRRSGCLATDVLYECDHPLVAPVRERLIEASRQFAPSLSSQLQGRPVGDHFMNILARHHANRQGLLPGLRAPASTGSLLP